MRVALYLLTLAVLFSTSLFLLAPSAYGAEIIINNGDNGTSSTGLWEVSGASGGASLYSKEAGATYTFESALSGPHDVFFKWTAWNSRCTVVPVEVYDDNGTLESLEVNQQENAGEWLLLGTHDFTGNAGVTVTAVGPACSTCVGAVRFVTHVPVETTLVNITLTWDKPEGNANWAGLELRINGDSAHTIDIADPVPTEWTRDIDILLTENTFELRAYNEVGDFSDWSVPALYTLVLAPQNLIIKATITIVIGG